MPVTATTLAETARRSAQLAQEKRSSRFSTGKEWPIYDKLTDLIGNSPGARMEAIPSSRIPGNVVQEDFDEYCFRVYLSPIEPGPREFIMDVLVTYLTARNLWPTEISFNMHPRPLKDTAVLTNHSAAFLHLQFLSTQQAREARELLRWNDDLCSIAPPGETINALPCEEMHAQLLRGRWGTPPRPRRSRATRSLAP